MKFCSNFGGSDAEDSGEGERLEGLTVHICWSSLPPLETQSAVVELFDCLDPRKVAEWIGVGLAEGSGK